MRHHLVQRIIRAYDEHKAKTEGDTPSGDSHANGKANGTDSALLDKNGGLPSEVEAGE